MSDYTTTPNLGLFKPVYNADLGQWPAHLNANADTLDSAIYGTSGYPMMLGPQPAGGYTSSPYPFGTNNEATALSCNIWPPDTVHGGRPLYLRTGGAAGSRLYVSAGAGTWTAVAGV